MSNAKILIVEDEGIEALDIQHRLTSLGYSAPDIVFSGEEAIEKAEETNPDLVLMDIMLPGKMDGIAAAEQIQDRFDIPIVYLTAYADENTLHRAKRTEPHGYIIKPFKERELHITIDMALYKHKMERQLKEREKWFATTLRSIGDAVIATDKDGLITFVNAIAEGLIGWKTEEIVNRKLTEVFHIVNKYTRAPVENPVSKVMLEGTITGLANHTILIAKDGAEIPIDDSAAPIKDDKGRVTGVILVFRDVTEREKSEEALRRAKDELEIRVQERTAELARANELLELDIMERKRAEAAVKAERQRFNDVLETLPAYLVLLTPDYHVPFANRFFRERFGESHGKRCFEYLFGRTEPCEICETYTVLKTNRPHRWEWTGPDGRNYDIYDFPFIDTDGSPLIMEMGIDITDRKQAEQEVRKLNEELELRVAQRTADLEAANKEIQAFSYSVSHDLRAPLRSIDGFSQALLEDYAEKLDETGKDYLGRVRGAAQRMGELIDAMLSLSRMSRNELRIKKTDLTVIAKELKSELEESDPERKIEFMITEGLTANGDPTMLRAVLDNLLRNAWKFTAKHEKARIEFGTQNSGNETVYYVRDDGAGFNMEYANKLFNAFQRLHRERDFPGIGIGLATVQRIIHRHGGRIWAEGEVDKGATFYFTLGG